MNGGRRWVVLGAGGHAASVAAILHRLGDEVAGHSDPTGGARFSSDAEALSWARENGAVAVPAVGDATIRRHMVDTARNLGVATPPVIASTAAVADTATLGDGTVVAETAAVGPQSTLGTAVIVNTGAVIEHHVAVGDYSHVAPRAVLLGAARVGRCSLVGAGAIVLPAHLVDDGATVGAGAVVIVDVAAGDTVVGVPARIVGTGGKAGG